MFYEPSVVVKIVRPGVIIELSKLNGVHFAHVLRLEHASCTPMGEFAHPRELALVLHCDDVSMVGSEVFWRLSLSALLSSHR